MGWLKKLGKGLLKIAAPIAGQALIPIPGVGAAIGGMVGNTIGSGRPTLKKLGVGALTGALTGGAGAGLLKGAQGAIASKGIGGAIGGGLKQLGGGLLRNPDLALGALSAYEQHQAGRRADKAAQGALDFERQRYAEGAPLRQLGMQGMLARPPQFAPLKVPRREDMQFDRGWSSNPFRQ